MSDSPNTPDNNVDNALRSRRKRLPLDRRLMTGLVVTVGVLVVLGYVLGDDNPTGRFLHDLADAGLRVLGGSEMRKPSDSPGSRERPTATPKRQPATEPPLLPTRAAKPVNVQGQWYQIYFTDPTCPPEAARQGGLDETIAQDLAQARTRIDVAAYELNLPTITDALLAAKNRKVIVRVVTDSDHGDEVSIRRLRRGGIKVVEDGRKGLMHNKFIVIDNRYLWVGAMNFASNDVYCHNNNTVRFDLPELARNYLTEMNEMYDKRQFGPDSPDNTPNEALTINGVRVENFFAPEKEKEVVNIVARTVARAQTEILFLGFSFTNVEIGEAMLGRAEAGVPVQGVFETTGSESEQSYYDDMQKLGLKNLQVRQDGNSRLMHHKVIVVDRNTVVFGSFNFSSNANRTNDENILIIYDPTFASAFVEEFQRIWVQAAPG